MKNVRMKSRSHYAVSIGILCIGLLLLSVLFYLKTNRTKSLTLPASIQEQIETVTPTPFPFEELTIPYLRKRTYESNLEELTQVSRNASYTSYTTSYTSDNLNINGLLTIPNTDAPQNGYPAIVFIHGYIPPTQYRTTEKYVAYVDYLARNGFVVFKIDLRGHGNSEGEPGGAYYSSDYILDTLHAREALRSLDNIDDKNIGLWGHSMAGNVVLRTLAAAPEIPAAVIWAGAGYTYNDLNEYRISDSSYQPPPNDSQRQQKRDELFSLYGRPQEGNEFWNLVKPTQYFSDFSQPIQIHHAINDNVVSILYSRNLASLLDKEGIPNALFEYEGGGHNIESPYFSTAMQRTVQFFTEHLQ